MTNERGELALWLRPEVVLVLMNWCDRMEAAGDYEGLVKDESERVALWELNCALDESSPDVFAADHAERLTRAQEILRPPSD